MKPMMGSNGLLECHKCGSLNIFACVNDSKWIIECNDCGKKGGEYLRLCSAVRSWNTRNGFLYTVSDYKQDALERANGL